VDSRESVTLALLCSLIGAAVCCLAGDLTSSGSLRKICSLGVFHVRRKTCSHIPSSPKMPMSLSEPIPTSMCRWRSKSLTAKARLSQPRLWYLCKPFLVFYRIAEVHFPSCKLWKRALHRKAGKKHAAKRRTLSGKAYASRFQIPGINTSSHRSLE